jgi:hypothetical protein
MQARQSLMRLKATIRTANLTARLSSMQLLTSTAMNLPW